MAHRKMYVTDAGAGFYRTRMLSAGDPVTLSGPEARLQLRLGNVVAKKPQAPKVEAPAPVEPIPTVGEVLTAQVVETKPSPSPARGKVTRTTRKRGEGANPQPSPSGKL